MPDYPKDKKEFFEMVRMMNDMSRLAFQTDSTRVITLFLGGQRTPGVSMPAPGVILHSSGRKDACGRRTIGSRRTTASV